jgi:hypothetical protein
MKKVKVVKTAVKQSAWWNKKSLTEGKTYPVTILVDGQKSRTVQINSVPDALAETVRRVISQTPKVVSVVCKDLKVMLSRECHIDQDGVRTFGKLQRQEV